ncbi:hypothetical protein PGT21_017053 [Puccinia graminis f. sp. tritici]|uniref:Uncharacterized protein n=1 Tax=Puccinia graminis f. sp. tritici TaxID=56615 RepID=A0A5B0QWT7_PUCGR|nr:hypothetical protein PGT21_017053 [Puccinia graminis f. sp. tritici]
MADMFWAVGSTGRWDFASLDLAAAIKLLLLLRFLPQDSSRRLIPPPSFITTRNLLLLNWNTVSGSSSISVISLFDPDLNFRIDSIDPDLYIISFFFNYIITTITPDRYHFISFFFINILALITPDRTAWSLWVYHLDQSGSNDINTLSASADLLLIK